MQIYVRCAAGKRRNRVISEVRRALPATVLPLEPGQPGPGQLLHPELILVADLESRTGENSNFVGALAGLSAVAQAILIIEVGLRSLPAPELLNRVRENDPFAGVRFTPTYSRWPFLGDIEHGNTPGPRDLPRGLWRRIRSWNDRWLAAFDETTGRFENQRVRAAMDSEYVRLLSELQARGFMVRGDLWW